MEKEKDYCAECVKGTGCKACHDLLAAGKCEGKGCNGCRYDYENCKHISPRGSR